MKNNRIKNSLLNTDIVGERFGDLVVKRRYRDNSNNTNLLWECKCSCGNTRIIRLYDLLSGKSTSCGCKRQRTLVRNNNNGILYPHSFGSIFYSYRKMAEKRGLDFILTKQQVLHLTQQVCFYCGKEPSNIHKPKANKTSFIYNGIDRLDNSLGYTIDNVVSCCSRCNKAKDVMSFDDFKEWIKKIINNLNLFENNTDNILRL